MNRTVTPLPLFLFRHAPAQTGGRLCGRTDVPLASPLPDPSEIAAAHAAAAGAIICSPALRCRQSVGLLWPPGSKCPSVEYASSLWEQDFGEWENRPWADILDIGELGRDTLAQHKPPGGESFLDVVNRVDQALAAIDPPRDGRPVAVVAHAGVIRAALSLALDDRTAGLGFSVDHLSVTGLTRHASGWAVDFVNRT